MGGHSGIAGRGLFLDLVEEVEGESLPAECDAKVLQRLFSRRPKSQKLTLVKVAQERLVNPGNRGILCKLMKEGLIDRECVGDHASGFELKSIDPDRNDDERSDGGVDYRNHLNLLVRTLERRD